MRILIFLGAAGAALAAIPAQAQDWRYCATFVKDAAGADRIALVSSTFDASRHANFKADWEAHTRPVAEAAMRQHATRGSVRSLCTIGEPRAETDSHKTKILAMLRRRSVLISMVDWQPGGIAATGRPGADVGAREETAAETASPPSSSANGAAPAATKVAAPKWIGASETPPPGGYGNWIRFARGAQIDGFDVPWVKVDYAYRVAGDEIRIVWRCTNESSIDLACSVGGGGSKTYRCQKANVDLGETRSLGERATVRAGRSHVFPSDWACRGSGATGLYPEVRIAWEK